MRTLQHYRKSSTAAVLLFIISLVTSVKTWAQEQGIDVNISTDDSVAWYSIWWVWVIAAALFVIILVAIVSAGKKT